MNNLELFEFDEGECTVQSISTVSLATAGSRHICLVVSENPDDECWLFIGFYTIGNYWRQIITNGDGWYPVAWKDGDLLLLTRSELYNYSKRDRIDPAIDQPLTIADLMMFKEAAGHLAGPWLG